jgi:hypothetical protein
MGQVIDAESLIEEHSESLRIAYAQARAELGEDPIFILYDHEEQPTLVAYEREVALDIVPEDLKPIVEAPADAGCVWVLVYAADSVTAAQLVVDPSLEASSPAP